MFMLDKLIYIVHTLRVARREDMEDSRLTPKAVLPGEMFDVEEMDRACRELDEDLAEMAQEEFDAWVASMEEAA
jgi:hypothetical protein